MKLLNALHNASVYKVGVLFYSTPHKKPKLKKGERILLMVMDNLKKKYK